MVHVLFALSRPLLLSSCIFPEDERSETVSKAIIDTIKEKADLLDQWRAVHEDMYDEEHDIPSSDDMNLTKFKGAVVTSDGCNAARLTSTNIAEALEAVLEETAALEGEEYEPSIVIVGCHHHMRNVWIGALVKHLSKYLNGILHEDLSKINFRYRVSTMFDSVLRSADKEFSLPANYPKGHGVLFKMWMETHHPGALLLAVERATGSRQDLAVEGAAAIYWNRK